MQGVVAMRSPRAAIISKYGVEGKNLFLNSYAN